MTPSVPPVVRFESVRLAPGRRPWPPRSFRGKPAARLTQRPARMPSGRGAGRGRWAPAGARPTHPRRAHCRPYGLEIPFVHELQFGNEGADVALAAPPAFAIMAELVSRIRPPRIPAMRPSLLALLLTGITAASLSAQEYVWMEGEAPTRATVKFETGGWGHADFLSGGSWLHGSVEPQDLEKKVPAEGAVLSYDFDAKTAGDYEAWVRIGYEFARSPFSWRLDGGVWKESKPEELTTDLMALQDWNEVAWLKLGGVTLPPGKHTFEIKFDRQYKIDNGKKEPDRILFGLDAICLVKGAWLPNGPFKPDEKENKGIDKAAAGQVFEIQAGSGGERGVTPLGGAWQIARLDEQEIKDRTEPVQELPMKADALHWKGIHVPGNRDDERPDLQYAHRFVYRARLNVPAEAKGRSCFLHFPCNAVISSAIVNGVYCGGSKAPCTAWDCDVTKAIKPGEINELIVAIKDPYYAIANTGDPKNPSVRHVFNMPPDWLYHSSGLSAVRYADFPVVLQVPGAGMFETPSFVIAGPAYTSDVFAMPSVKNKTLGLEISVANPTGAPIAVKIADEVVAAGRRPCGEDVRREGADGRPRQRRNRQAVGKVGESEALVAGRREAVRRHDEAHGR